MNPVPTDLLSWGREVLAQQPFSVTLGAQLDVFELPPVAEQPTEGAFTTRPKCGPT